VRRPSYLLPILVIALIAFAFPRTVAAAPAPTLAAPSALSMSRSGDAATLTAGTWINATRIDLHMQVTATSGPVTPQVEVEPVGAAFTNNPTTQGSAVSVTGGAVVTVQNLQDGTAYHWQARITDAEGNVSPWVPFSQTGTDFGADRTSPAKPVIGSSTNPRQSAWYHNRVITVTWGSTDAASGIAGYTYSLQRGKPHGIPAGKISSATGAKLSNMADGVWYLVVRARDNAGNWSANGFFRMQLDRTPARIIWQTAPTTFDPYNGPVTFKFSVSKPARVRLTMYRVGSSKPVQTFRFGIVQPPHSVTVSWSGKRGTTMLPRGYYFFAATTVDHASNVAHVNVGAIRLNPIPPSVGPAGVRLYANGGKEIIVVLSQQTLYAYNGTHLDLKTYVTTGNPALPTPIGSYSVMAKYHPYEMVSPWPPGSPYYYAPSWMSYAMLFRDGGYFLHDAPWRSAFGPGTNGPGQPGTNYGGTHGCVNIPPGAMSYLWTWTPIGTRVLVVN
jgi:chitodextrinase